MKNILGLDLGTNSIGWALIQKDEEEHCQSKIHLGSRIIPMSQDVLGKFEGGSPIETQTASRTQSRGMRRLLERRLLRRERLFRVLHKLGFLPEHFDEAIGWDRTDTKTLGKFKEANAEPKLAWRKDEQGKMQFLFKSAFAEMLADFREHQPQLLAEGKKVPYDWTLYYLRQKALVKEITKEELAWILLSFNQKRGYYQLRGMDEVEENEDKSETKEYVTARVVSVEVDTNEKPSAKGLWYQVHLDNGMIYRRQSKEELSNWVGMSKEFVVTRKQNKDGSEKLSFSIPKPEDWTLRKVRTEKGVAQSGLTVGAYIYRHLLEEPSDRIIGKYVETIDRKFYKEELKKILTSQSRFHAELTDPKCLWACAAELYASNETRRNALEQKDMSYLLIEDVLFYQRPLKSKKSLIADCPYEYHKYVDKETGEEKTKYLKCVAKSNPYFQEFRIRQFMQNLKVFANSDLQGKNLAEEYWNDAAKRQELYRWLNDHEEVTQDALFKDFFKYKKNKGEAGYPYRWNYVADKKYPMGETHTLLKKGLEKAGLDASLLENPEMEYRLWHLLYSIDDIKELHGALEKLADRQGWAEKEAFVAVFTKLKPFKKEYGSYSEKALKKLLPHMRAGQSLHEACKDEYDRWSEAKEAKKWTNPEDMKAFINGFRQHSLRNPIVEQCVLETLRTVHDLWKKFEHIDEIHLELGREMKNPADKRKRISEQIQRNEDTNLRIKALLMELLNDKAVEGVHPNSPMQQDILRIYEEGALLELNEKDADFEDIKEISKLAQPSSSQLNKYKLWLEQKYLSPYTGKPIPLAKLFTSAYQIEHVIPRSRYFDDSFNNKVICEAEVNKDKSNLLAHEYICQKGGSTIHTVSGDVTLFNKGQYEDFVRQHYSTNRVKQQHLMMDDVPEEFIQRQMNDSRYISKYIKSLLSNIVREEGEDQDMSKNVIVCTGSLTDRLKKDWGMNDVWNHLVYPRYERLNNLTGTSLFGQWETKTGGKRVFQTNMPLTLQRGYSKQRIDHRHHAMDALVIACASRNIVNYLSNENANDQVKRQDLKYKVCGKSSVVLKPWDTFTQDAEQALASVVVSFKNKVRVLTRTSNYYEHYDASGKKVKVKQSGENQLAVRKPLHKETMFGQVNLQRTKEDTLDNALDNPRSIVDAALRQQVKDLQAKGLDKKKIKKALLDGGVPKKVEVRYFTANNDPMVATRKPLDDTFNEKKIQAISDTGIQKILLNYLSAKGDDPKKAFSPEGIAELNEHIREYNNGKFHQPIIKVRLTEPMGEKFSVAESGQKATKFAEAQSGTNLYFGIYESADGERAYYTIPLHLVMERLKQGLKPVPETDDNGRRLKFSLSPNDLVYVPNEDEKSSLLLDYSELDSDRIYRFVSSSKFQAFFCPEKVSKPLLNISKEISFGSSNVVVNEISVGNPLGKVERDLVQGIMIKSVCWKLEVDRLGQIINVIR